MKCKKSAMKAFFAALSISQLLCASDAEWTGSSNNDLNNASNWIGDIVPTGVATFDSAYPSVNRSPAAYSLFTIDNLYFPHSASVFDFELLSPGALQFTGIGLSGKHTNATFFAENSTTMSTAQVYFSPGGSTTGASLGNANFYLMNGETGTIAYDNAAQLALADSDAYLVVPLTAGDDGEIVLGNNGVIQGYNEAAQIFLKGSSLTVSDQFNFEATNEDGGSITAFSDAGQMVFDAGNQTASLTIGDQATLSLFNTSAVLFSSNNNVGQIIFDGKEGIAAFTLGDKATVAVVNQYGSLIANNPTGNDAGQMVFDGNNGTASLLAGDDATIILSVLENSSIQGQGFDTGQIVIDGDGGIASFTVGEHANIVLTSSSAAINTILSGADGNDAGQIVIDGNNGIASFVTGDNAAVYLSNTTGSTILSLEHDAGQIVVDGNKNNLSSPNGAASFTLGNDSSLSLYNAADSSIVSSYNTGQFVVEGNNGTASVTLGNNNQIHIENNGSIANSEAGSLAAQIVFNGTTAGTGNISFNTGPNTFITAVLNAAGTITTAGESPAAQMYFNNTTVKGSPTLTAINLSNEAVEGIVFDGTSTAIGTNIALQNSTLLLNTESAVFSMGSLSGDASSLVKLNQNLQIVTPAGQEQTFAGIIVDECSVNSVTISGSGTQVLAGANTYGGNTYVNEGILLLNGSVVNEVVVNSGGLLAGSGTVDGSVFINPNGTMLPGLNPGLGTFNINQNYTQQSGGVLYSLISGTFTESGVPESSLLNVAGTAALAGTIQVVSADGTYSIGRPYTVITAGAIDGLFEEARGLTPFLNVEVLYNQDPSVQLILSTDFASGAQTNNQLFVAEQIDGVVLPIGNEETVINNLLALSTETLPKALDEMAGEQYCYLVGINQYADFRFGHRIFDAVRPSLDPCFYNRCGQINTWMAFESEFGRMHNRKEARGYKEKSLDFSFGLDAQSEGFVYGAALNLESNQLSFNLKGSNILKNIQGALYGVYTQPKFYLFSDFIVGGGYTRFRRSIHFANLHQVAHSKPKFTHGQLYAEAGYNLYWHKMLIQPFLGGDSNYVHARSIHEQHAEALNLQVKSHSVWSENLYLGAHLTSALNCIKLNADLVYQHRFGSLGTKLHTKFSEFGDAFVIKGANYSRNGFIGNVNASVDMMENVNAYVEFAAECWEHRYTYAGSVGFGLYW